MARRRDDHGIEHEPWLRDETTGDEAEGTDPWQLAGDEPALRGAAGVGADFHAYYLRRRAETTDAQRVLAVTLAALVAGPFAIVGAIGASIGAASFAAILGIVLFAPVIEEVAKASGAVYLVERHPWVIRRRSTLPLITLLAGLFFAVVENVLYLEVYIEEPTTTIVVWRWIAGPLLHGGAAFVSGLGVARMWERVHVGDGLPDWSVASPFVIAAIVIHALYNGTVTVLELAGFPFA